ncbi:MAG: hypothetical protein SPK63_01935 [Eubacteriales bacterium]|nr:hypothetical protein [Eubacteriales bacterium]
MLNSINQYEQYYLSEFDFFDGEYHCIFNILEIKENYIICSLNKAGKLLVQEYDLYPDKENNLYFEYGPDFEKIYIEDFEKF